MEAQAQSEERPTCKICGGQLESYERHVCEHCMNKRVIQSYSYKPSPHFYPEGRPYDRRAFGIEIEVHAKNVQSLGSTRVAVQIAASLTKEAFGDFAYLKCDGSLSDSGFEIVTHPATYRYLRENRVFDVLDKLPVTSYAHRDTGLHIHVSRKLLTKLQLCKIVYFYSDPKNQEYLKKVAQRDYTDYCKRIDKGKMKHMAEATESNRRASHYDRYQAVNLINTNTVEFRMFKGNVKPEAIYKAIQFVDALIEFTARQAATKLDHTHFIEFVSKNERRWNLLATWNKGWKKAKLYTEVLVSRREIRSNR